MWEEDYAYFRMKKEVEMNENCLFILYFMWVEQNELQNVRNEKHFRLNFQTFFFSLFYLASCNCLKHVGNFHRCGMKPAFSIYLFIYSCSFLAKFLGAWRRQSLSLLFCLVACLFSILIAVCKSLEWNLEVFDWD